MGIISENNDPYLWLEDITGKRSMEWVQTQNDRTLSRLQSHPIYASLYEKLLKIHNSTNRIALPTIRHEYVYNFWQDEKHVRGIWRRSPLNSYLAKTPQWEILLDIDKLSKEENESWVFKGTVPFNQNPEQCILQLSKGGKDAVVLREFNIVEKEFVTDGFIVDESKSYCSWYDENTLLISTDFGNETVTDSGYPFITKKWKRGTLLDSAEIYYIGKKDDMIATNKIFLDKNNEYKFIHTAHTFFEYSYNIEINGSLQSLDLPLSVVLNGLCKEQLILSLRKELTHKGEIFKGGSVLSVDLHSFLSGEYSFDVLFTPKERVAVSEVAICNDSIFINTLDNVSSKLLEFTWSDRAWHHKEIPTLSMGTITIISEDRNSNSLFFTFENFLTASTLYHYCDGKISIIQTLPSFFKSSTHTITQHYTQSKDNTAIPYYVVKPSGSTKPTPTLLDAYGGFEIPRLPLYNSSIGSCWLEEGFTYVLANIRGGGEFGPQWHQAGLKENRQRVYDDYFAVVEDLFTRKITTAKQLAIMGRSNGGLLMGVALTQRPKFFEAVICAVPLLDMKRYNKLLAGASWMAEYGNPDTPEEWEYIKKYSPYHNLNDSTEYPHTFFTTTTKDDRVHPGHARKMAALMNDYNHSYLYFENTEGGHAAGTTSEQKALVGALEFTHLHKHLVKKNNN